jgi:hypothetical protein
VTRHPFPNNVIPAGLISTVGKNIASYYPIPNLGGLPSGAVNYTLPAPGPENRGDEFVGKIDHQFFKW